MKSIGVLLTALSLTLLIGCGDDAPSTPSVDWTDVTAVTWEKLTSGEGTWVMGGTATAFYRSPSAASFGADPADSLSLTRYYKTNNLSLKFFEETIDGETLRWCIVNCVNTSGSSRECREDDKEIWREVTGENPLTIQKPLQETGFLGKETFSLEGARIDQSWFYLPQSQFLQAAGSEAFWKM